MSGDRRKVAGVLWKVEGGRCIVEGGRWQVTKLLASANSGVGVGEMVTNEGRRKSVCLLVFGH